MLFLKVTPCQYFTIDTHKLAGPKVKKIVILLFVSQTVRPNTRQIKHVKKLFRESWNGNEIYGGNGNS